MNYLTTLLDLCMDDKTASKQLCKEIGAAFFPHIRRWLSGRILNAVAPGRFFLPLSRSGSCQTTHTWPVIVPFPTRSKTNSPQMHGFQAPTSSKLTGVETTTNDPQCCSPRNGNQMCAKPGQAKRIPRHWQDGGIFHALFQER